MGVRVPVCTRPWWLTERLACEIPDHIALTVRCPRLWAGAHTLLSTLEELTQVRCLDLLTALPSADVIDCRHLLRTTRAWCSSCYEGWRSSGPPVYEPLLWMLQVVTVCPDHRQSLDSLCPRWVGRSMCFLPKLVRVTVHDASHGWGSASGRNYGSRSS